jgi:predicted AAA+ superfamily ATPase
VDLVIEQGSRIIPIEVKMSAAVDVRDLAGLRQCMADLGLNRGHVVTTASERRNIGKSIAILPWQEIARGEVDLST